MSGYVHGASVGARLERQLSALTAAQRRVVAADKQATKTTADANRAANKILTEAIKSADKHRIKAQRDADRIIHNAKILAERESSLIRERAYLEGRTRADAHQIETDKQAAGTRRRDQLDNACRQRR